MALGFFFFFTESQRTKVCILSLKYLGTFNSCRQVHVLNLENKHGSYESHIMTNDH